MRFLLIFSLLSTMAQAQMVLLVTQVPAVTPVGDTLYVAGNFNGWNPGNSGYALTALPNGQYVIALTASGTLQFKFTRGSWSSVEGTAGGGYIPNRSYPYVAGDTLELQIAGWEDLGSGGGGGGSTAAPNVQQLLNFAMPPLNRTRRIWVYLPPDYDSTSAHYRVMYAHDGQNLFDATTSFSGEWEVDETLNALYAAGDPGTIVVGVDHGGSSRLDEYNPWVTANYGGGEGDAYLDFLVYHLKPYIDANYRTLPDRSNTAIFGSSMGGLISWYAGLRNPEVFGRAGIFSPAYWIAPQTDTYPATVGHPMPQRVYQLAGGLEGNGSVAAEVNAMHQILLNAGFGSAELNSTVVPNGQHSEWFWAQEFENVYNWLWAQPLNTAELGQLQLQIYPNPSHGLLRLKGAMAGDLITLMDLQGKVLLQTVLAEPEVQDGKAQLDVPHLPQGCYTLRVLRTGDVITLPWMHIP